MADRTKMIGSLISYFEKIQGVSEIQLKEIETRLSGMSDQELMQVTKQFEGMKKGGRVGLEDGGFLSGLKNKMKETFPSFAPIFDESLEDMIADAKKKGASQEEIDRMTVQYNKMKKNASKKAGGGMIDKPLY